MSSITNAATSMVNSLFGGESGEEADAKRKAQEAQDAAQAEAQKLSEQQKVIAAQQKAQEDEENAKKKRMANAFAGGSGLLNINPEGSNSILG